MTNSNTATQAYQQTDRYTKAEDANPHELITMLYEGAIERIIAAKGAMQGEDVVVKGMLISKAIHIISGLRAYLDVEKGGELAENLESLYAYSEEKLFQANFENNETILEEVVEILQTLREGWVSIKPQKDA